MKIIHFDSWWYYSPLSFWPLLKLSFMPVVSCVPLWYVNAFPILPNIGLHRPMMGGEVAVSNRECCSRLRKPKGKWGRGGPLTMLSLWMSKNSICRHESIRMFVPYACPIFNEVTSWSSQGHVNTPFMKIVWQGGYRGNPFVHVAVYKSSARRSQADSISLSMQPLWFALEQCVYFKMHAKTNPALLFKVGRWRRIVETLTSRSCLDETWRFHQRMQIALWPSVRHVPANSLQTAS